MSQRFALSRGQFVGLIVCLLLGGVVLFVGGMVTGAWLSRSRADAAAEGGPPSGEHPDQGVPSGAGEPGGIAGSPPDRRSTPPERIYEVQVAARLTREEAEPEVERLASAGYPAYIVETKDRNNHSIFTVRMGPWSSANEAAREAQAFREHSGLEGLQPVIRHRPRPPDATPRSVIEPAETPG